MVAPLLWNCFDHINHCFVNCFFALSHNWLIEPRERHFFCNVSGCVWRGRFGSMQCGEREASGLPGQFNPPAVTGNGASGSTANVYARNKKKHWAINYHRVTMKPSFEESCFSELVVVCHLPPRVSRTACTRPVEQPRQGVRRGGYSHQLSPRFTVLPHRLQSMIWECWIQDWAFCSFQTLLL